MANFTALTPVDMETDVPSDLGKLGAFSTTWTSIATAFAATSSDGSVEVDGTGNSFNPTGFRPTTGNLTGLLVKRGDMFQVDAFSMTGLTATINDLYADITTQSPYVALQHLLSGNDTVTGSDGIACDHLHGFLGSDTMHGGDGDDILDGDEGDDHLFGDSGADHLNGGADNDELTGGAGHDVLDGGSGNDTAIYTDATHSVAAALAGATPVHVTIGGLFEDTIASIESIHGGLAGDKLTGDGNDNYFLGNGGNDVLNGAGGGDRLSGGAGKDVILGGAGADVIAGDAGRDTLTGGGGKDTFVFNAALNAKTNVDTIKGFSHVDDTILLFHGVFSGITAADVAAHDFFTKGAAHNAHQHIIYQPGSGDLLYDADGNGGGKAVLFAHLAAHLNLTAADFVVVG